MSFTLRLSQDLTAVEAGATVPLSIEITNKGDEVDRFEMQVEGLDPEWTASPEPVFTVGTGETHVQKVFFKPPRASESLAGNYPFVVRVRSLNSGDTRTAQGVLQIKAFHHLSMELSPKKGYTSPMRQQNNYTLTIMNLGNTEHTLQLGGADPEEECTFDFANDQVTVGPGQQKQVELTVGAAAAGLISPVRLFGFSISARSIQNPNLMTTTQGQLERRPLLTTGSLMTLAFFIAVIAIFIAFRPQPPSVTATVDTTTVLKGQPVRVHWKAQHANSVRLEVQHTAANGTPKKETFDNLPLEDTREIVANKDDDTITISAIALGDHDSKTSNPVMISVQEPPEVPKPVITSFKASKTNISLGESVTLTFKYSKDVTKLVLSPTNQEIIPPNTQIELTPTQAGEKEYTLYAYNDKNGVATKTLTINAREVSEAIIAEFRADPAEIVEPETQTTVSWKVNNAVLVQLDDGLGGGLKTVDPVQSIPVVTDRTITLRIIATDAKRVSTSQKLTIKYKPMPKPPGDTTTTGGNPPTTGGDTSTTTGGN